MSLNYNVFRYGIENTIPGIIDLLKGVNSDVAKSIRRIPDFVIQNTKDQKVYFLKVKFRASGEFKLKDLPKNYPYHNANIILVSKAHIKCITVPELLEGKEIPHRPKTIWEVERNLIWTRTRLSNSASLHYIFLLFPVH